MKGAVLRQGYTRLFFHYEIDSVNTNLTEINKDQIYYRLELEGYLFDMEWPDYYG
jgi:hypothetical protein